MDLVSVKKDLSVRCKNGIAFLLSGLIIWTIITIIFLLPIDIFRKNIFMLFSTGLMFPLSLFFSNVIKSEWNPKENPLSMLGQIFNLAQFMYFPLIFWALFNNPDQMVMFFAVITGAHFFPFGWVYNAKAYYVMALVISISVTVLGWTGNLSQIWLIPIAMVILLVIQIIWLYTDYRKKI